MIPIITDTMQQKKRRGDNHGATLPYLYAWRAHALLSQKQLAGLAGLSKYTILNIEVRRHGASPNSIRALAQALCITPQQLIEQAPPHLPLSPVAASLTFAASCPGCGYPLTLSLVRETDSNQVESEGEETS